MQLNNIEDEEEVQELNFEGPEKYDVIQVDENVDTMLKNPDENIKK